MKVGFLVNPIAGMGGSVGLKGTDGTKMVEEAERRGATRSSPLRATEALRSVRGKRLEIEWLTCAGLMGKSELDETGFRSKTVYEPRTETSSKDTIAAVGRFIEEGVSLVVFAGGDGTARDVFEIADRNVPMLGIPTGVKMQSSVFLNSPDELGDALMTFVDFGVTKEAEVMDVNEDSYRRGILEAKLFGIALVPDDSSHMQSSKASYRSGTADEEAEEIGQYVADSMEAGAVYIMGPGSTTAAIVKVFGEEKTLLGADVYVDRERIVADGGEEDLLRALDKKAKAFIIVSPIGAQGFIFGRGNQQISARVIERVTVKNIITVATPTKLRDTRVLRVDTGSRHLDEQIRGKIKIITGYRRRKLVQVL